MKFGKISLDEPKIVSLDKNHQLIYFESTNIELNEFLINDSLNDQNELISRSYLSLLKILYPVIFRLRLILLKFMQSTKMME